MKIRLGIGVEKIRASGVDANAAAFIAAAGITGSRQQDAVIQWFKDVKGVGSTPNSTNVYAKLLKWRLCCPVDDSTVNATVYAKDAMNPGTPFVYSGFVAGDFVANGVTGGLGKHMDLGVSPVGVGSNDYGIAAYIRTNSSDPTATIGCSDAAYTNGAYLWVRYFVNDWSIRLNDSSSNSPTSANSLGLCGVQRIGGTKYAYKNAALVNSYSVAVTSASANNIYGHAMNLNGAMSDPTARQLTQMGVYLSLTANEWTDLNDAVERFETNVISGGRNV